MSEDYAKIREVVLSFLRPFSFAELYFELDKIGISNRSLTIRVMDDLFEEGLVRYIQSDLLEEAYLSPGLLFEVVW